MIALIATVLLLVAVLYWIAFSRRDPRLPPGEYGWPIIGRLPTSKSSFIQDVEKFRKKFGDVFLWRLGGRNNVYICDPKLIKKAYANPSLIDRPLDLFTFDSWSGGKKSGIINNNGESWQLHRKFALKYLRESGLGTSIVEDIIDLEAENLIKDLEDNFLNTPIYIPTSINVATINVIWKLTADIRFKRSDEDIQMFLDSLTKMTSQMQGFINLLDAFPWMVPFTPTIVLDKLGFNELQNTRSKVKNYIKSVIEKRRSSYDKLNPRGLIDGYLAEMENNGSGPYFDADSLTISLGDLFLAGSDTTATTIRWGLMYMACYPEVQKKIQEEIDAAIPRDRRPRIADKHNLAYTEAAVHDILRVTTLTPFGLFHAASSDTTLEHYTIPKGTVIFAFLYGCHMDPRYWSKPNDFYPEHFLDSNGNFSAKNEAFMPFGSGRRSCLGEPLAKTELFLFTSAILQKFSFRFPDGEKVSSVERNPDSVIFGMPPNLRVVIEERK